LEDWIVKPQAIVFVFGLLVLDLFFQNPAQTATIVNQLTSGASISLVGGGMAQPSSSS
jgi:hypothetical protein